MIARTNGRIDYARCTHCDAPAERGTADEIGRPYCSDCADNAVYGAPCTACGTVPGRRRCAAVLAAADAAYQAATAAEASGWARDASGRYPMTLQAARTAAEDRRNA